MPKAQAQPFEKEGEQAATRRSVDDAEIARFSALADTWWDPNGPMKPLHRMNPVRIGYIREQITARNPSPSRGEGGRGAAKGTVLTSSPHPNLPPHAGEGAAPGS